MQNFDARETSPKVNSASHVCYARIVREKYGYSELDAMLGLKDILAHYMVIFL